MAKERIPQGPSSKNSSQARASENRYGLKWRQSEYAQTGAESAVIPKSGPPLTWQNIPVRSPAPVVQALGELPVSGVPELAAQGLKGATSPFPHLAKLQQSFGHHQLGSVRAHTGAEAVAAAQALGARAYAFGQDVAFASPPSLFTAAHEAAHVVQQRAGLQLPGGAGSAGDAHEQHASEVARCVTAGGSAEALLDQYGGASAAAQPPSLQMMLVSYQDEDQENNKTSSEVQRWRTRYMQYSAQQRQLFYDTEQLTQAARDELLSLIESGEYRLQGDATQALRWALRAPRNRQQDEQQSAELRAKKELREAMDQGVLQPLPDDQNNWTGLITHARQAYQPFRRIMGALIRDTGALTAPYTKIKYEEFENPLYVDPNERPRMSVSQKLSMLAREASMTVTNDDFDEKYNPNGNYVPNSIKQMAPSQNRPTLKKRIVKTDAYSGPGDLKEQKRTTEKALGKYYNEGRFKRVLDVVRGTLTYTDMEGLYRAMLEIVSSERTYGYLVVKCKQSYIDIDSTLYGDVKLLLRESSTGHICEVQLTTKSMVDAKALGHKPYKALRTKNPDGLSLGTLYRQTSSADFGVIRRAVHSSHSIYGPARSELEEQEYFSKVIKLADQLNTSLTSMFGK